MPKKSKRKVKNSKTLILALLGLSLLSSLSIFAYFRLRPTTTPLDIMQVSNGEVGKVNLAFSPDTVSVFPGETMETKLYINTYGLKVSAAQIHLTYDVSKVEIVNVAYDSFLPTSLDTPKINNGTIVITPATWPTVGGKEGTGSIATIKFKSKTGSIGTTKLAINSDTQIAAVGYPGNVLRSAYDVTLTDPTPITMYFYTTDTKVCNPTNSQYTRLSDCKTNIEKFAAGRVDGLCYSSEQACKTAHGL